SAECAARASPTTPRSSRRTRRARRWRSGRRTDLRSSQDDPWRCSSGSGFRYEARVYDGAVAGERRGLDDLVVPVDVERLGLLVDEDLEEGEEIARVEARRGGGEPARHVVVADDLHAVDLGDTARLAALPVAAALDRA